MRISRYFIEEHVQKGQKLKHLGLYKQCLGALKYLNWITRVPTDAKRSSNIRKSILDICASTQNRLQCDAFKPLHAPQCIQTAEILKIVKVQFS